MHKGLLNNINTSFKSAFTLIELLVVIAIIGILSGLIIVGMSSTTQSATIAKAQIFSASLRDSLLMNIVSSWKLDDASGSVAADSWNSVNNGTIVGFTDTTAGYGDSHTSGWMTSFNCISKTCLKFDGINDYINLGSSASLKNNNLTYSLWIYPLALTSNAGNPPHIIFWPNADSVGLILNTTGQINCYVRLDGSRRFTGTEILSINKWYHIAFSYDGRYINFYVNGVKNATTDYAGTIVYPGGFLALATADDLTSYNFKGLADEFTVYNAAIPASQIKEQYYAGLNRLFANGGISNDEYQGRVESLINNFSRK